MVRERGPQVKKIDLKIANKDSENYKYALEMCNCTNAHFYFRSTFDLRWKTKVRRLESRDMKASRIYRLRKKCATLIPHISMGPYSLIRLEMGVTLVTALPNGVQGARGNVQL